MKMKKRVKILIFSLVIVAVLGIIYMLTVVGESQTSIGEEKQDLEESFFVSQVRDYPLA